MKKTLFQRARAAGRILLGYDAIAPSPTRRPVYISTRSEDRELPVVDRRALVSEARDQLRNFSLAGFALRKHLQFVSYYRFSAETPSREFNRLLERRVARWKRRENCDAARRSNFDELIAQIELCRAVDGDVGLLRRADGRVQIVEGDRLRNPDYVGDWADDWANGVKFDKDGRALSYGIWRRLPLGEFEFEREISADNFDLLAFRTRRDQLRGVSLFAPAIRMISYLYDGLGYALAKLKLEQALGLVTKLEDGGNLADVEETDAEEIDRRAVERFGTDLFHVSLRVGEEASFLESNNPSGNFQSFVEVISRMIFAALDLPYSFYDGSKTNFYGSKGEFEQYLDSVGSKQAATLGMLDEWIFDWLLPNWLSDPADPLFDALPNGWTVDDLRDDVGWRGASLPSWRLCERIKETILALDAGLLNPFDVATSYGESISRNLAALGAVRVDAEERGLVLPYGAAKIQTSTF